MNLNSLFNHEDFLFFSFYSCWLCFGVEVGCSHVVFSSNGITAITFTLSLYYFVTVLGYGWHIACSGIYVHSCVDLWLTFCCFRRQMCIPVLTYDWHFVDSETCTPVLTYDWRFVDSETCTPVLTFDWHFVVSGDRRSLLCWPMTDTLLIQRRSLLHLRVTDSLLALTDVSSSALPLPQLASFNRCALLCCLWLTTCLLQQICTFVLPLNYDLLASTDMLRHMLPYDWQFAYFDKHALLCCLVINSLLALRDQMIQH